MLGKLTVGTIWDNKPDAVNVYIGRSSKAPSPLGNPWVITAQNSRDVVCDKYEEYIMDQLNTGNTKIKSELNRIGKLLIQGQNVHLTCYCKGKGYEDRRCHGDFLKAIVDEKLLDYQAELGI